MRRYAWQAGIALALVVCIVLATRADKPVARKAKRLYWRTHDRIVGEKPVTATWTVERPKKQDAMATKTQTRDNAQSVSGTVTLQNLNHPAHDETPVNACIVTGGIITLSITDITTTGWAGGDPQPDPPGGTQYTFVVRMVVGAAFPPAGRVDIHYFVYIPSGGPYGFAVDYSLSTTANRVWRDRTDNPSHGRSSSPVYATDTTATDTKETENPMDWAATFGELDSSGTQVPDALPGLWTPDIDEISSITMQWKMMSAEAGYEFARISLNWNGVATNFSGRSKLVESNAYKLVGDGNSVYIRGWNGTDADPANTYTVTHAQPRVVDWSQFAVWDRDGNLKEDLRVSGGFTACEYVPSSLTCSTTP